MKIVVLGGAGFIGMALVEQLSKKHEVVSIDLIHQPLAKSIKNITSHIMDLSNLSEENLGILKNVLLSADVVYSFASSIGVEYIKDNPRKSLENSVNINNIVYNILKDTDIKLIFASTSEVYGNKTMCSEDDNLSILSPSKGNRGSYAAQKILAEFQTKLLKNYTIVRFFNVVGKGQNPNIGMVVPRFINQAKNSEDITVFGDGSNLRSYCDIKDCINVLELLLTHMNNEILNIGADNQASTLELANKIIELSNSKSKIKLLPKRDEEISERQPDLSKMKSFYIPKYKLSDIIKNLL